MSSQISVRTEWNACKGLFDGFVVLHYPGEQVQHLITEASDEATARRHVELYLSTPCEE